MGNELTGKKVSFTYQNLVQYVDGSFYDGLGNPVIVDSSLVLSNYATNASLFEKYDKTGGLISGDVSVAGYLSVSEVINFASVPFVNAPYAMGWDTAENTVSIGLPDGGSAQVGKELFEYYVNLDNATLVDGDIVSVVATPGNRPGVQLTDVRDRFIGNAAIGMVTSGPVAKNGTVRVTLAGMVRDLNTLAWPEGRTLYVDASNPGKLTINKPTAPNILVVAGIVTNSHQNQGIITVPIIRPMRSLSELSDVNGTPLTTVGQFLTWHPDVSVWDADKNINDYALKGIVDPSLDYETYSPRVSDTSIYYDSNLRVSQIITTSTIGTKTSNFIYTASGDVSTISINNYGIVLRTVTFTRDASNYITAIHRT